ncbi:MAG: ATP-binding cassette domain-containing protein [Candidatus Hinthialibacter antarcticus]|nr:ATP-binding cassette domain-containing protein [Candidatus Hinthialibacter antarcticus]
MSCLIEISDLQYCYPDGRRALQGVNLHIKHGQRVGLIGPNGAGKTTLFHVLAGVIDRFDGSVSVARCNLNTPEGRKQVHRKLGIVFQQTDDQVFHASVEDDIAFGPLNLGLSIEETQARVDGAMKQVGLDESFKPRLPFHLSGGEKRRVAIAGILAMQPEVLLLDEPSSDLDPRGRRELVKILNALPVTRIISSHNLDLICETCERVVLLDEGTVQASGPTEEILMDRTLMEKHGLETPGFLVNRPV